MQRWTLSLGLVQSILFSIPTVYISDMYIAVPVRIGGDTEICSPISRSDADVVNMTVIFPW